MIKALLLSSLALNLGLLLGRLSGFAREAFVAATYGATPQADIVVLMLSVPDLLVNILMGGAMGAALVPEFSQHSEQARKLLYQSLLFFGMIFIGITVGLYWQADILVALLVPGFSEAQAAQSAIALGWVIWLVPLTVLAGVVTAYLHAQNKFAVAAIGTLIINSSIIGGLLLVYFGHGYLRLVAAFALLGGLLRLCSQLLQVRPVWNPLASLHPVLLNKALLTHYGQAMLSGSVLLLFPVVARAMASYEVEGSVALFNYAARLVEFPLAIAVTFLTIVFFPRLAKSFLSNPSEHRKLIQYGTQITLGLSMVAAITLATLSLHYSDIVYGHGDMQNSSVELVATLTAIGLTALPLQGLAIFLTAVFNSRKDTRTPLLINGTGLIFFLLSNNAGIFGQGLQALMWGIVASYGLICFLQSLILKIESLSWWRVLFNRTFFPGIICAVIISVYASQWIQQVGFSAWLSLVLASFVALLSLSVMALFNENIRVGLKARLNTK